MSDLLSQNMSTVQSISQPAPITLTAAATIAPQGFVTFVSGNTAVATITPFVTGQHMLCIIPSTTTGFTSTGNIIGGTTTVSGRAYLFVYDTTTTKYYLVSSTTS